MIIFTLIFVGRATFSGNAVLSILPFKAKSLHWPVVATEEIFLTGRMANSLQPLSNATSRLQEIIIEK